MNPTHTLNSAQEARTLAFQGKRTIASTRAEGRAQAILHFGQYITGGMGDEEFTDCVKCERMKEGNPNIWAQIAAEAYLTTMDALTDLINA